MASLPPSIDPVTAAGGRLIERVDGLGLRDQLPEILDTAHLPAAAGLDRERLEKLLRCVTLGVATHEALSAIGIRVVGCDQVGDSTDLKHRAAIPGMIQLRSDLWIKARDITAVRPDPNVGNQTRVDVSGSTYVVAGTPSEVMARIIDACDEVGL